MHAHRTEARRVIFVACASALCSGAYAQGPLGECDQWRPLGGGFSTGGALAMTIFGDRLVAAGGLDMAGGVPANNIAIWDGAWWEALGAGMQTPWLRSVHAHGNDLYAGGSFTTIGFPAQGLGRWDGAAWIPIATGITGNTSTQAITVYNGELVIGLSSGTSQPLRRWTGTAWQSVGGGVSFGQTQTSVSVLEVIDGSLYVGGSFRWAGPFETRIEVNNIARWDGELWHAFGSGIATGTSTPPTVNAIARYEGDIVASGRFNTAGGTPAINIARWNPGSQQWHSLADGLSGRGTSLVVYGGTLVAGGRFPHAGNVPGTTNIARWDGSGWHPMNAGLGGLNARVEALTLYRGELIAAGYFETMTVGGLVLHKIASWRDCPCYANCDQSTQAPILSVDDFMCFIDQFAAGTWLPHHQQVNHYANCDGSTTTPVLNIDDFVCFINSFAAGCP